MRLLTQVFQPVISIPKNAKIKNTEITCKSQKLLLECGLVRPTASGLFTILPLARRALHKLESLIRSQLDACGGQQLSVPALTAAQLWEKSGRIDEQADLVTIEDRHGKKFLLAPTHEESIADLLADVGPLSYKQLPLLLYQIGCKYRDEYRPKHGLLRAREFSMMDAYGVHSDSECAQTMYDAVGEVYKNIFDRLNLSVHKVKAPSGDMGGSLSHEWQLCAGAGEDQLSICPSCSHTQHKTETDVCHCGTEMNTYNSIEVGHTFVLGTKYSEALGASYIPSSGTTQHIVMSCYGIGITRLLAAALEHLSTEKALRWPTIIAPFDTIIIGPKEGSKEWSSQGPERIRDVYGAVTSSTRDVIVDDRHNLTIGKRLMMADRMGYPNIIVMGKSTLDTVPKYEVYTSGDSNPRLLTMEELKYETVTKENIRIVN